MGVLPDVRTPAGSTVETVGSLSFREFLVDYQAKEEEETQRYWRNLPNKGGLAPTHPSVVRLQFGEGPASLSGSCNLWGLIPFQGKVVTPVVSATTREEFDRTHGPLGFTSHTLDRTTAFARDTNRLRFHLMGPATAYERLDFLRPLLEEFRPPILQSTPLHLLVPPAVYEGEWGAIDYVADKTLDPFLRKYFAAHGVPVPTTQAYLQKYRDTYVALRVLGVPELADLVDECLWDRPWLAHLYLEMFSLFVVEPIIDVTGMTRCFTANLINMASEISERVPSRARADLRVHVPYEVGRFILKKAVLFPETPDGCLRALDEYNAVDLARIRSAFVKAIESSNTAGLATSSREIESACSVVWEKAAKYQWIEFSGRVGVSVALGVVGGIAGAIAGQGVLGFALGAAGGTISDSYLANPGAKAASNGLASLIGKSHMLAIYDFKQSVPTREPAR